MQQSGKTNCLTLCLIIIIMFMGTATADEWRAIQSNTTNKLNSVMLYGNNGLAVGNNGTLLYTKDGGETWQVYYTHVDVNLNSIAPYTKSDGSPGANIAGDEGTILQVDNNNPSGVTIENRISLTPNHDLKTVASPSDSGFKDKHICAGGMLSTLWLSKDNGQSWYTASIGHQVDDNEAEFKSMHFIGTMNGYTVRSDGTFYKTTDGGANWYQISTLPDNMKCQKIEFTSESTGWVCGKDGRIAKTTDGGKTWTFQSSGTTATINDIQFKDNNTGICVGNNGYIAKTHDGGQTWEQENPGVTANIMSAAVAGKVKVGVAIVAVGDDGTIITNKEQPAAEIELSQTDISMAGKGKTGKGPHTRIFVNTTPEGLGWEISSDKDWIYTIPESGSGKGMFDVYVDKEKYNENQGTPSASGKVTVTLADSEYMHIHEPYINVKYSDLINNTPPVGAVTSPQQGATINGTLAVSGWALDDVGVQTVKVYEEKQGQTTYLGDATFVEGATPDVPEQYKDYPNRNKAGWIYYLQSNQLNNGQHGLTVEIVDENGNKTTIEGIQFQVNNAKGDSPKPFGNIDTPAPGGTVWGPQYPVTGWTLTPPPGKIYAMGGTTLIYIDDVRVGYPLPNIPRPDIAALFPNHLDAKGAGNIYYLDTQDYSNGVHSIEWRVTDNQGNKNTIGSRFFTIQNSNSPSPEPSIRSIKAGAPAGNSSLLKSVANHNGNLVNAVGPYNRYFQIMNKGQGDLNWEVSTENDWITLEPTSGSGPGWVQVILDPAGLAAGMHTGIITISESNNAAPPEYVQVDLDVHATTNPPFGSFDYPPQDSSVSGNINLLGWALDDIGVRAVNIYQHVGEDKVLLGSASMVDGNRVDIQSFYSSYPMSDRAGWKYTLKTNEYENGSYSFSAEVKDYEGNITWLTGSTFSIDNSEAQEPFGDIEYPAEGEIISGQDVEITGWVLAAPPNTIATDGSSIVVDLNGMELGSPIYNLDSPDIAELYPEYVNASKARFRFNLDTTPYPDGDYSLNVLAWDDLGNFNFHIGSKTIKIINTTITRIEDKEAIPTKTELLNAYPNPFNPTTQIEYHLAANTNVSVHIYDILGRHVRTLVDKQYQQAGTYHIRFNSAGLASGVYFCRFTTGNEVFVKKMMLMK